MLLMNETIGRGNSKPFPLFFDIPYSEFQIEVRFFIATIAN